MNVFSSPGMKVAVLSGSVSRRGGGIFEVMRALCQAMYRPPNVDLNVFGLEDPESERDAPSWGTVPVETAAVRGPRSFGYAPRLGRSLSLSRADLLHVHGLWMYTSVAAQRWKKHAHGRYIVSPHGMLDAWALQNSRLKKQLAAWAFENDHLRRAACLHALCEPELDAIRAFGLTNPVCVIPNGVALPNGTVRRTPDWRTAIPPEANVLLYLGRLHPKKGLHHLLPAFAEARRQVEADSDRWHVVIAGWDQDGYQGELTALANQHGIADSVHFVGPQFGEDKTATFAAADAFVLPSVSEGLPMAVLEAWAFGLPVLMTPHCNLPDGFAAQAAVPVEANHDHLVKGLLEVFTMSEDARKMMGRNGLSLVREKFTWGVVAEQMEAVYRWVLGRAPQPDCVRTV